MDLNDILTLMIAIYGAAIATILGIRELQRDKRHISVILEYVSFYEHAQITITNIGHRPITISEINMTVKGEGVPRNALFQVNSNDLVFPLMINDGEYITLPLHSYISESFLENTKNIKVSVYDIEGNIYTKYKSRIYDPKWGFYVKKRK